MPSWPGPRVLTFLLLPAARATATRCHTGESSGARGSSGRSQLWLHRQPLLSRLELSGTGPHASRPTPLRRPHRQAQSHTLGPSHRPASSRKGHSWCWVTGCSCAAHICFEFQPLSPFPPTFFPSFLSVTCSCGCFLQATGQEPGCWLLLCSLSTSPSYWDPFPPLVPSFFSFVPFLPALQDRLGAMVLAAAISGLLSRERVRAVSVWRERKHRVLLSPGLFKGLCGKRD